MAEYKVVIDGRGSFHSLSWQLARTYSRVRGIEYKPFGEAIYNIDSHLLHVTRRRWDFRVLVFESASFPPEVEEITLDRRGDGFKVVVRLKDGRELDGEDVVFSFPGGWEMTAREWVERLLEGLGWTLISGQLPEKG